jgi:hypothetical protein
MTPKMENPAGRKLTRLVPVDTEHGLEGNCSSRVAVPGNLRKNVRQKVVENLARIEGSWTLARLEKTSEVGRIKRTLAHAHLRNKRPQPRAGGKTIHNKLAELGNVAKVLKNRILSTRLTCVLKAAPANTLVEPRATTRLRHAGNGRLAGRFWHGDINILKESGRSEGCEKLQLHFL